LPAISIAHDSTPGEDPVTGDVAAAETVTLEKREPVVPEALRGVAFIPESGQAPVRYLDSAEGVSVFRGFDEEESQAALQALAPRLLKIALKNPQANRAYLESHGYRVEDGEVVRRGTARAYVRAGVSSPARRLRRHR